MAIIITIIQIVFRIFIIVIIVDVFLTFFMSPFHPVRRTLDQFVQPFLNPIRRVLPIIGGFDFSPIVLLIIVQIVESLLIRLLAYIPLK